MALTIPTRAVDDPNPPADVNAIVAEVNRLGLVVDAGNSTVIPATGTDDTLIDTALATGKDVIFPARTYTVNASHTITTDGQRLIFMPGAIVRIGEAPTGNLATYARVFAMSGRSKVQIIGAKFQAPITPLAGAVQAETGLIWIDASSDCEVRDVEAVMSGLFQTATVDSEGYKRVTDVVFLRGVGERNRIQRVVARNCRIATYSYLGTCRSIVRDCVSYDSPHNGLSGVGNAASGYGEDCTIDNVHVFNCARIGIEDWNRMRGTRILDCRVRTAGLTGMSAMSVLPVIHDGYVRDPGTYTGVELSANGSILRGTTIRYTTGTPGTNGVIVDGLNWVTISGGDGANGARVLDVDVTAGQYGIRTINTNTGVVQIIGCRIRDWKHKAIEAANTGTGVVGTKVSRCYLWQTVASASPVGGARIGIQVNPRSTVRDCSLRYDSTAGGGTDLDIPLYLGTSNVVWTNNSIEAGGITTPAIPRVTANAVSPSVTGVVVDGLTGTGGLAVTFQWMTSPVTRNISTDGTVSWGTGSAGTGANLLSSNSQETSEWSGNGTPEAVVTAPVGSRYYRRDGAVNTTLYVKVVGTGNTGWVPVPNALVLATGATVPAGTPTGTLIFRF